MASPSVSFRISRSAEDLAGTLHLLSQRLVQLEQRLAILEARERLAPENDPALEVSLGNAERLLFDCRSLLEGALQEAPAAMPQAAAATEASWILEEPEGLQQITEAEAAVEEPSGEASRAGDPGDDFSAIPLFQQEDPHQHDPADHAAA